MSYLSRIASLTSLLSAQERAVLLLRATNTGTEPDPDVLGSMPPEQRKELHHYLALAYVANGALSISINVIAAQTEDLTCDRDQVRMLEDAAGLLERDLSLQKVEKVRGWRKKTEVTVPEFLRGLAGDLRDSIRERVAGRWQELRAVELEWEEIKAEFGGEDIVHPDLRARAATTAATLRDLRPS